MQEDGKNSIRALPNEILLTIFSYLQTHDVKYNVSKVCLQWSTLSRDKKLWRQLNFKTTNRSTKIFGIGSWYSTLKFFENTPELQNVIVSQGHSEDEVAEILKSLNVHCQNLYHIEFDVDMDAVVKHLKGLDNILKTVESLKLNLGSTQSQANSIFKVLSGFKKLRKVAFSGPNPDSSCFRLFLRDCSCLDNLNVTGVEFSKANFMSLWKFKDKFVSLAIKIDKLDENCLKLLSVFPNLKNLLLVDGNSSPGKLDRIGRLKCLKSLQLQEDASSPVLTSSALTNFFQDGCFFYLKELKLHKSRLNDEGEWLAFEFYKFRDFDAFFQIQAFIDLEIFHCNRFSIPEFVESYFYRL